MIEESNKEWWKNNLKFDLKDWRDISCGRCEKVKPIVKRAHGYGAFYDVCKNCWNELKKDGDKCEVVSFEIF